jgi:hypothetical protein
MPEDRKFVVTVFTTGRIGQSDKVEDKRVDSLVWQSVLLVEQYTDEQGVGS